jgi:hypothetical protein
MIEAKAFGTLIRICSLYESERLSANIELILHKALIRLVMIYACPTWGLAADTYLLKLQRVQNKVKVKPDVENIRGLNLAVVKLTTVQVTKLPL